MAPGKMHFLFMFLWMLVGCKQDIHLHSAFSESGMVKMAALELDPVDYKRAVERPENGLRTEKRIDNFNFSLQYKPYEYIVCTELAKKRIKKKELEDRLKEINQFQYFLFKIEVLNSSSEFLKTGIQNASEYEQRVAYCSFKFQNDIKLVDGRDTLACNLFHFERIYGVASYGIFLLGFPLSNVEYTNRTKNSDYSLNDKTLIYDDKIFGVGTIHLKINSKDLNQVPKIKTI